MAKRMVDHVLSGYFSCLFCYGQTGTGKTTTIMGKAEKRGGCGRKNPEIQETLKNVSVNKKRLAGSSRPVVRPNPQDPPSRLPPIPRAACCVCPSERRSAALKSTHAASRNGLGRCLCIYLFDVVIAKLLQYNFGSRQATPPTTASDQKPDPLQVEPVSEQGLLLRLMNDLFTEKLGGIDEALVDFKGDPEPRVLVGSRNRATYLIRGALIYHNKIRPHRRCRGVFCVPA